jgi:hypothetical protein
VLSHTIPAVGTRAGHGTGLLVGGGKGGQQEILRPADTVLKGVARISLKLKWHSDVQVGLISQGRATEPAPADSNVTAGGTTGSGLH